MVHLNKSLVTNLLSVGIIVCGYLFPWYQSQVLNVGYFALSGSVTNWLAIHMLFEKVPGFYGSGVIPNKFEEFKRGIYQLIMNQFFTKENVESFFSSGMDLDRNIDVDPIVKVMNLDRLYGHLVDAIKQSAFGPMLEMMGGEKALLPMKEPVLNKIKSFVEEILQNPEFIRSISQIFSELSTADETILKVGNIVEKRLEDLTPNMVKEIIQEMIREHLGWLVVWGGVFGGLIGLITSFLIVN